MSNEVLGYFVAEDIKVEELFKEFEKKFNIGIKKTSKSELYNYPKKLLRKNKNSVCFVISDSPNKSNSTYLTDYLDYISNERLNNLPKNGKERLFILLDLITELIEKTNSTTFVFSITECSQIDNIKTIKKEQLNYEILKDFEEFAPPNCLYIVQE